LRKFAEGSGQSAGEFYTPGEVAILMSYILNPEPGDEIYEIKTPYLIQFKVA
jgi:type I restriction enzyme M protein